MGSRPDRCQPRTSRRHTVRLMREGSFSYDIHAACTPAAAIDLLSDLTRQGELHPLIVSVVEQPPATSALRSYRITDVLRLGPLPLRVTYHADVLSQDDNEMVTQARQWPRTKVVNRTSVRTSPDGRTHVHVEVTLRAPSALHAYALRTARTAHLALAERIASVLESD